MESADCGEPAEPRRGATDRGRRRSAAPGGLCAEAVRRQKLQRVFSRPAQGYRRAGPQRRRSRLVSGMPPRRLRRLGPPRKPKPVIVRDAKGQALAYVYFEEEPGPRGGQAAHARQRFSGPARGILRRGADLTGDAAGLW